MNTFITNNIRTTYYRKICDKPETYIVFVELIDANISKDKTRPFQLQSLIEKYLTDIDVLIEHRSHNIFYSKIIFSTYDDMLKLFSFLDQLAIELKCSI